MNLTKFKAINIMTFIMLAAMAISNVFLATVNAYGTEPIYPVFYAYGEAGRPEIKIVSTRVAGVLIWCSRLLYQQKM